MNENHEPDPPASELSPPETSSGSSLRTWILSGVVAAACALGVGYFLTKGDGDVTATAAQPADTAAGDEGSGFRGRGAFGLRGEIREIDGTSLVVASTDPQTDDVTEVTVNVSGDTTITETTSGSLADIEVGASLVVVPIEGDDPSDGSTVAASLIEGQDVGPGSGGAGFSGGGPGRDGTPSFPEGETPPSFPEGETPPSFPEGQTPPSFPDGAGPGGGRGGGGLTAGEVVSISGDVVTIETADGDTIEVTTSADTTISVTREISLDALAVGDTITVTPSDTSQDQGEGQEVEAAAIRKGDALGGGGMGPISGRPRTDDGTTTD